MNARVYSQFSALVALPITLTLLWPTGCRRTTPTPSSAVLATRDEGPSQGSLQPGSTSRPTVAITPVVPTTPTDSFAPIDAPVGVNLVASLALSPTVSSSMPGAATAAGHLTDNDPETAWNSQTGDLVNAWFELTVPHGAAVQSFAMTAGFTHHNRGGDLFTQNHRLVKVRVQYNSATVGEYVLDPNNRGMQSFALNRGAGVYRVTAVEVLAGSRASWRELCVSEFALYGTVPAGTRVVEVARPAYTGPPLASEIPHAAPQALTPGPSIRSIASYCREVLANNFDRDFCRDDANVFDHPCYCGDPMRAGSEGEDPGSPVRFRRPVGPFLAAMLRERALAAARPVSCDLFLRTPAGLFPFTDIAVCGGALVSTPGNPEDLDRPAIEVLRMAATQGDAGAAELRLQWRAVTIHPRSFETTCEADWEIRCVVDALSVPACIKTQLTEHQCYPRVRTSPEQPITTTADAGLSDVTDSATVLPTDSAQAVIPAESAADSSL